jgi:hypothetical protein
VFAGALAVASLAGVAVKVAGWAWDELVDRDRATFNFGRLAYHPAALGIVLASLAALQLGSARQFSPMP